MQKVKIQTTQNVIIEYYPASVGDRILAYIIDFLVVIAIGLGLVILGAIFQDEKAWVTILLVFLFVYVFYHLFSELVFNGQSVGKKARDIKVVRLDGSQPSIGGYILRWLFRVIDISFYGIVGILCITIGGKGQRLGDIVAGTTVIKLNVNTNLNTTIFSKTDENYQPTFPEVSKLSDRDIEIIKESIAAYHNNGQVLLIKKVAAKTAELMEVKTDLVPLKFLNTVVKDYNHITGQMA